jgi:hypothetical protein
MKSLIITIIIAILATFITGCTFVKEYHRGYARHEVIATSAHWAETPASSLCSPPLRKAQSPQVQTLALLSRPQDGLATLRSSSSLHSTSQPMLYLLIARTNARVPPNKNKNFQKSS